VLSKDALVQGALKVDLDEARQGYIDEWDAGSWNSPTYHYPYLSFDNPMGGNLFFFFFFLCLSFLLSFFPFHSLNGRTMSEGYIIDVDSCYSRTLVIRVLLMMTA
jgi:hypothetical protein